MAKDDPATKGDIEDAFNALGEGIGKLIGKGGKGGKAPAPVPVEKDDDDGDDGDGGADEKPDFAGKLAGFWFGKQ